MKCKKCKKNLTKGIDYYKIGLCRKCYSNQYITNKWANDKKYRKEQTIRIVKWQKEHPERTNEIARKTYYKNKQKV